MADSKMPEGPAPSKEELDKARHLDAPVPKVAGTSSPNKRKAKPVQSESDFDEQGGDTDGDGSTTKYVPFTLLPSSLLILGAFFETGAPRLRPRRRPKSLWNPGRPLTRERREGKGRRGRRYVLLPSTSSISSDFFCFPERAHYPSS
jgi:hypothetical protein